MSENNLIVTVAEGKLKGKNYVTYNDKTILSFQGIPYAKPPIGDLRFKAPHPPEKWEGIKDVTTEGAECYSKNYITNILGGSEDCLFLNVYTPKIKGKNEKLPVMFWIHGGGFVRGDGSTELYGPDYIVEKNVVLVTINYRLGVLGFLAISDPSVGVPGNAGLKDIVMALKWVQRNISVFSGDPNNVTIFGESAGGSAVELLILSPMAKGLFHKAINQSGSALNCFTRGKCSSVYDLAKKLGIENNDDTLILSELQKVPVEDLVRNSLKIPDSYLVSILRPFCVVIEPKTKEPGFLTEEPLDIIKSGRFIKVPRIIGYNSLEGIFVHIVMKHKPNLFLSDENLVPHMMNLRIGSDQYKKVALRIREMYKITGKESDKNAADLEKALNIFTHNFFSADICRSARYQLKHNEYPIYFYRFDLDTEINMIKKLAGLDVKGVAHADDLSYFFTNFLTPPPESSSLELKLISKLTKIWTNFAKHGNPTPSIDEEVETIWDPITVDSFNYLSLENDGFKMLRNPDKDYMDFWYDLYEEFQFKLSKL
ncbi:unnamed protein product [Ceutorhynchus assimilis]|uniref:Carboxylesterase type B domain-containing protein n=1 Tax=Ceutorhynchus assimilis TaxID=467358 RepID=A0A9N9QCB9_9CUCU|nr:unnamed protein product [Ceutorhynchus assimilis]